jgi:hypothetical protein
MAVHEQIQDQLREGRTPEEVVQWLLRKGMSDTTARKLVAKAQAEPRRATRAGAPAARASGAGGRWDLTSGAFFLSLGVFATATTYVTAEPGGKYMLAYGAIVAGLVELVRGFLKWREARSQAFPVLLVAGAAVVPALFMGWVFMKATRNRAQRQEDVVNAVREEEARRGIEPAGGKDAPLDPVSTFLVALKRGDPATRREATFRLGEMKAGARDAIPALQAALGDSSASVREGAGDALLKIAPQDAAVRTAVKALLRDPSLDVWLRTAVTLAGSGDPDAIALLTSKLDDNDLWARERAASALGNLGERGTAAIPQLVRRLQEDPDYQVRIACAQALGRLGSGVPSVAPALTAVLTYPDPRVQAAAKEALAALGRE